MTTSFTRTREQLATLCLRKLGILAANQTAASADAELVYEAADLRLKEMHRLGIFWRKVEEVPLSFTVSAGNSTASATADILFPIALFIADSSRDEPVEIINVRQYAGIEDKDQTGLPVKALWEGGATFRLWPVPTTTTTAKLVYEKIADDTTAGAAIDVDVSMLRWIRDIICYDLGDIYGKPEGTMLRWQQEATIAERNIRKLNAQKVDFAPVAVDDFDSPRFGGETDYGWYRP